MNRMKQRTLGTALAGLMTIGLQAQLVVSTDLTPAQLVQDVLLGSGVTATNVVYNGVADPGTPQDGTGSFTQIGNLGVPAGMILSCGFAEATVGPATNFQSDDLLNNGNDADLQAVMGFNVTNYAILEFDFVPIGDTVKFNYVFGSEEYPAYICSFNDGFGFFLSGPGIAGPYSNGAVNIALLPDGTPVTINNVNNGLNNDPNSPTCPAVNSQYYVDNEATTSSIAYDGMTTVLQAKYPVQCGETYHIKLAIADAGGLAGGDTDTAFDSGVFLEAGSFSSSPFVPQLTPGPGIVGNTILESCFPMSLTYIRLGDATDAASFLVDYSGTFTNGTDISPGLPTIVEFAAGETSIPFTFSAPVDADGEETLVITVESFSECTGQTIVNVFNYTIADAPPLDLQPEPWFVDCGDDVEIGIGVSGGYGVYTYDWGSSNTDTTLVVAPLSDTTYPVTVTDVCGLTATADVPVQVVPTPNPFSVELVPAPTVDGNTVQESCYEVMLNFTRTGGVAYEDTAFVTLTGNALGGEDFTLLPIMIIFEEQFNSVTVPISFPQDADGFETMIINLGDVSICNGGFSILSYAFSIAPGPALFALGGSPVIPCGGSTMLAATVTGGYAPYSFQWTGGATDPTLTVGPTSATTYTATITDDCANTTEAVFNVDLLAPSPINMAILGPSTVTESCETTSINIIRPAGVVGELVLNMTYNGNATNGADFTWPATQTLSADVLNTVFPFAPLEDGVADNDEDVVITASFTDACGRTVTASVTITLLDAPPITLQTTNVTVPCSSDSLPVTVVAGGGFGGLDLLWSTGDQGSTTYVQIQAGGTYVVTATDACGRTATAESVVDVDCEIIIPNVFTPNGDGFNDRFDIDGILGTENTVKVFNRWGQVVFEAKNYRNTWAANGISDGTYYYEVMVTREPKPLTGHVTILRNGN